MKSHSSTYVAVVSSSSSRSCNLYIVFAGKAKKLWKQSLWNVIFPTILNWWNFTWFIYEYVASICFHSCTFILCTFQIYFTFQILGGILLQKIDWIFHYIQFSEWICFISDAWTLFLDKVLEGSRQCLLYRYNFYFPILYITT